MTRSPKSSIKRKVTIVIMRASIGVLLVTVAAFMIYDLMTFRQTMVQNLFTQARTIADNSTAALAFGITNDAANVLSSLETAPHVTAAALYDAQGRLFAKYPATISDPSLPASPQARGYQFGKSHLTLFQPVVQSSKPMGTLYLQSDLTALSQRLQIYGAFSLLITAGSLLVAFWLSNTLQWRITNPIIALAKTARNITSQNNFSARAQKASDDEIGDLTDAFNTMLDQIQTGHADLEKSRAQLQIVTDYASVLLCHVDREEIFHFVNPAYAARFNLTPQQVIGRSVRDIVGSKAYESFRHYMQRALAGERVEYEMEIFYEELGLRWMHCIYVPENNSSGSVVGFVGVISEITERKRQEMKLSKLMLQSDAQARLFDATLSSIKDLAYTFDLEGNWIYANKPLLQLWGKSLKEITGKSSLELNYPPELAERLKQQVKEVVETRQPVRGETYFTDAAGVEDYHEYIFSPVLAADGTVTAVCGTTRLTTERKRVESLLRQNEALFSALVEQAPNGVYVVDGQFRLQQINARALPAFAKVEPKIGRDFGEVMEILWGPEIGPQLAGIFRHTLATGEPYRSPRFAEHRHDLNEDKAYEWETQRITLPDGTHGVVCYFSDITDAERNQANLAFLATISDDLLRLDTVDDILTTVCAKTCDYLKLTIGCFVEINEAADTSKVTHEWRRPEMPGLIGTYKLSDYLSDDFQKTLRNGECFIVRDTAADPRTDAKKYAELKIHSFVCVPLIADGRWKFMFNIHDSRPRDWRADEIGLMRELTARIWARLERVRAESLRRQNEALFAALIEEAPVGVYVVNAQFRLQQINTRALPLFEKVEPKMGRTLTEVMHIQWGKEAGDELAALFRHTLDTGESYISPGYTNTRADLGEEKTYEWQVRRVTLPDGQHGVVCYFSDVTERERAAAVLRNSEALYRTIGESINYGVWVCDAAGRNTYASESFLRLVGLTQEQCSNMGWGEVLHPDDIEPTIAAWKECIRTSGAWDREHRFKGVDGQWHHVLARGLPVKDSTGKILSWAGINLDISGLKHAEEASRRLAAIVEFSDDAILSKDLNSIITSWNRGAERIFGYQAEEVIGKPITMLMPPDRWNEEPNILDRIRRGQPMEHYETIRQRKDGSLIEISLTVSPIRDAAGKIIGASKIVRDIGRQNQAKRELERAHAEAVAASRAKDDFLAALSHELRTPLNPVLLLASAAAEDPQLPAEVRTQFTTIRNNVELEARLIDDLLDITRVTHGKLSLAMDWVDVNAVLHTALAAVKPELDEKRIALNLNFASDPLTLKGDAVRLQQVFWNVIKNAIKFTPVGGKLTIETFASLNGDKTTVKITDTGIGMTVEEIRRIFKAFSQGDHAGGGGSHRFGGLGLGLSISRMLVELHAGNISATSAGLGQGATFIIELPLLQVPAGDGSPKSSDASNEEDSPKALKKTSGMRILLVEDHEATRTALAHLLTRRDYKVTTATSVAEARAVAQREKFDLLVSDIGLPDGDGYALMSELREKFGLKGIALSGYGMDQDVKRGQNAGFIAHLIKPVRVESLEKALGEAKSAAASEAGELR